LTLEEYKDGILLYEIIEKEVWRRSTTDTVGLKAFFEQNQEKYWWNERRDFTTIKATGFTNAKDSEKMKNKLLTMVKKGKSDEEIQTVADNHKPPIGIVISHAKYEKGANRDVDALWEVSCPYAFAKTTDDLNVDIICINKVIAPEPKTLVETRGMAVMDYQNWLEKNWLDKLHSKYPTKVNQEALQSIKK
jgi:peptidyl-prolyl cis-trans isomerase SurA